MVSVSRAQPQTVQGVPPYGASGQVLAKTSEVSYADTWVDLPPYGSMQCSTATTQPMMDVRSFVGVAGPSTLVLSSGAVHYVPVWLEVRLSIINMGFWILTQTASNVITAGGAQCLSSGLPGPTYGTACSATFAAVGFWTYASSVFTPFTLQAGWNYLWLGNSGSTTNGVSSISFSTPAYPWPVPQTNFGNGSIPATNISATTASGAWTATGVGGVAPSSTPSVTSQATPPLIYYTGVRI